MLKFDTCSNFEIKYVMHLSLKLTQTNRMIKRFIDVLHIHHKIINGWRGKCEGVSNWIPRHVNICCNFPSLMMSILSSFLNVLFFWCSLLLIIFPYSYANLINPVSRTKHRIPPKHPKNPKQPKPKFGIGPWKNAHATFYGGSDGTVAMGMFTSFFILI